MRCPKLYSVTWAGNTGETVLENCIPNVQEPTDRVLGLLQGLISRQNGHSAASHPLGAQPPLQSDSQCLKPFSRLAFNTLSGWLKNSSATEGKTKFWFACSAFPAVILSGIGQLILASLVARKWHHFVLILFLGWVCQTNPLLIVPQQLAPAVRTRPQSRGPALAPAAADSHDEQATHLPPPAS